MKLVMRIPTNISAKIHWKDYILVWKPQLHARSICNDNFHAKRRCMILKMATVDPGSKMTERFKGLYISTSPETHRSGMIRPPNASLADLCDIIVALVVAKSGQEV